MKCPFCKNEDESMIELVSEYKLTQSYLCNVCARVFVVLAKHFETALASDTNG